MRRHLAAALLLALGASGAPRYPSRDCEATGRRSSRGGVACDSLAFFEFAPASGAGLPSVGGLCDQLTASELSGGWCLNGDGTSASGGASLSAVGSPTDGTSLVCPNGPNCGNVAGRRLNGSTDYYKSANVTAPEDLTVCWLGRRDNSSAVHEMVGKDTLAAAQRTFDFRLDATGNVAAFLFRTDGDYTSLSAATAVENGVVTLVCFAYDYIAHGTSVARVSKNGSYVNGTAAAVGPPQASASAPWEIGVVSAVASYWPGTVLGAFMVPSFLDDTRIAAIARAVLADTPTGAKGEALTYSRTGARGCIDDDTNTGSILPADRPCVRNGGLLVEGTRTNYALRSSEFDNASWILAAGGADLPVITANTAVAPDGTTTAERLDFPSTTGGGYSVVYQGRTGTAASWATSLYIKGVSGSGTIYLMSTPGGSYNSTACAFTSTAWSRCVVVGTETAATWYTQIGFDLRDGTQSGQGAQSVYLWHAQAELGTYATSPIPTTTAAGVRGIDTATSTLSAGVGPSFSMAATYTPISAAVAGANIVRMETGGNLAAIYRSSSSVTGFQLADISAPAVTWGATNRLALADAAGTISAYFEGSAVAAPTVSAPGSMATVRFGLNSAGTFPADGLVSRVCVDPSPTRCR